MNAFPQDHSGSEASAPGEDTTNILNALWRYRWAVIIPTAVGLIASFLIYLQLPETYRSTTRLMVESDQPAILDTMRGDVLGGVPSLAIVQSQLFSDKVVEMAFNEPRMRPFHEQFNNSPNMFVSVVHEQLILEPEVEDLKTAKSLVTLLHFEGTDPELCEGAVHSFSEALQAFFDNKQRDSRGDLLKLISTAMEELHPKMTELEKRYREFRSDVPLSWDAEGNAKNPHREQQLALVKRKAELFEVYRSVSAELVSIESIAKRSNKDPLLALNIIGQLLDKQFVMPTDRELASDSRKGDNQLAQIELDQQLVPLMIEANKYEAEYGANHPSVKSLKSELSTMKAELRRLVEKETARIVELMRIEQEGRESINPVERAKEAVRAVVYATKAQQALLKKQISELDEQIAKEHNAASKLSQYEQENLSQIREIERTRELLDQLENQMARVSLLDEEAGTRVVELTAPTPAYLVGPSLIKALGLGTFLGLLFGSGLAILLEKNANTFRDPDEIAGILGVPVLTHVPFFRGKLNKIKKGEVNTFEGLDPYLTVLHNPSSVAAEAIRSCRTSIFFETADIDSGKIVQVTSPLPGDGKSTIAGNLACSIAQSGKSVLAIDCDLRRPQLTDNFNLQSKSGLTNVLNGECDPIDASHQMPLANLRVMPSGPIPTNPAEALTLPDMGELLDVLREEYDYVILDTPPLLVVTDPSITASLVDGVIMALRIRRKSKPNAKESVNILRSVGANLIGLVINNSDESSSSDGYRGYGYYRYGRYTSRYKRGDSGNREKRGSRSSTVLVSGRGSSPLKKANTSVPKIEDLQPAAAPTSDSSSSDFNLNESE